MGDTLITVVAIALAAVLMFVFPLMSIAERTDDISQLAVNSATVEFTDKVRTTGKLTLDDYEKFIQYCKENKENLKPFEIIHYSTNIKYIYPIARFSNSNYYTEYDNVKDYGLGLFVDIYPLDGINDDDKSYKKRITFLFYYNHCAVCHIYLLYR